MAMKVTDDGVLESHHESGHPHDCICKTAPMTLAMVRHLCDTPAKRYTTLCAALMAEVNSDPQMTVEKLLLMLNASSIFMTLERTQSYIREASSAHIEELRVWPRQ